MTTSKVATNTTSGKVVFGSVIYKAIEEAIKGMAGNIKVNIFGLGTDDEALYEIAKSFLDKDNQQKMADFEIEMKKSEYSFFWFENVIAKMQQSAKDQTVKGQATKRLEDILDGDSFAEQLKLAGPALIKRKISGHVKDGWEIVKDGAGKILILSKGKIDSFSVSGSKTAKKAIIDFTVTRGKKSYPALQLAVITFGGMIFLSIIIAVFFL